MVNDEQKPRDSRELEGNAPVGVFILAVLDLVIDEHACRHNQVGQQSTTDVTQSVLVQSSPGRVGGPKEDGLC